jgi:hypothetical protein
MSLITIFLPSPLVGESRLQAALGRRFSTTTPTRRIGYAKPRAG